MIIRRKGSIESPCELRSYTLKFRKEATVLAHGVMLASMHRKLFRSPLTSSDCTSQWSARVAALQLEAQEATKLTVGKIFSGFVEQHLSVEMSDCV